MVIQRVGVWSAAKIYALINAIFGLIMGGILALVSLVGAGVAAVASRDAPEALGAAFGFLFGVGAVVAMPLFYGLLGLAMGAIGAALYNLAARFVGGLVVSVE